MAAAGEWRERLFRLSVLLKGADGLLEIIAGAALLVVTPEFLLRLVSALTQDELVEDPRDPIAGHLLAAARGLSLGTEHFWAVYLLGHGLVKVLLVAALLQGWLWSYPVAILVLVLYIAYQLDRFTHTHGLGLIALSLFDLVVIALIWLEYRALRARRAG